MTANYASGVAPEHDPIWRPLGGPYMCICGADLPDREDMEAHVARTEVEAMS